MNTAVGGLTGNGQNRGQFARRNTNIDPADLDAGLKSDDTLNVEGLFDLLLAIDNGDRYGIRFTDAEGGDDDRPEIAVRRGFDGVLRVQFRELSSGDDVNTFLNQKFSCCSDLGWYPWSCRAGDAARKRLSGCETTKPRFAGTFRQSSVATFSDLPKRLQHPLRRARLRGDARV